MAKTPKKLGRSLLNEETTVAEIRELTKRFTIAKHYIRDEMTGYHYDSVVVDGDLVLGELDTFAHKICRLVVKGSLKISGTYNDYDDPETAVFVLGDFEAENAITNGALCVAGNVHVHAALVGYYNDHCAEILGGITTTLFVPENHHFGIGTTLAATYVAGSGAEYRVSPKLKKAAAPSPDATLREALVPEVFRGDPSDPESELDLDQSELRKRVATGKPVLAAFAKSKPATKMTPTAKSKPARSKPARSKPAKSKPAKPVAKSKRRPR